MAEYIYENTLVLDELVSIKLKKLNIKLKYLLLTWSR